MGCGRICRLCLVEYPIRSQSLTNGGNSRAAEPLRHYSLCLPVAAVNVCDCHPCRQLQIGLKPDPCCLNVLVTCAASHPRWRYYADPLLIIRVAGFENPQWCLLLSRRAPSSSGSLCCTAKPVFALGWVDFSKPIPTRVGCMINLTIL